MHEISNNYLNQTSEQMNASDVLKEISLMSPKINKKNRMEGWNWRIDIFQNIENIKESLDFTKSPLKNDFPRYNKGINKDYIQNLKNIINQLNTPDKEKTQNKENEDIKIVEKEKPPLSKEKDVSLTIYEKSNNCASNISIAPKVFIPDLKRTPFNEKVNYKILSILFF